MTWLIYEYHQVSIFRPILFNIYIFPLLDVISNLILKFHTYAYKIHIYQSCTDNPNQSPNIISSAIDTIHKWLSNNLPAFNSGETESLFLHLLYRITPPSTPSPIYNETIIPYSPEVRNLGVIIDSTFSFNPQVANLMKSIQYQLHSIRIVHRLISTEKAVII